MGLSHSFLTLLCNISVVLRSPYLGITVLKKKIFCQRAEIKLKSDIVQNKAFIEGTRKEDLVTENDDLQVTT